MTRGRCPAGGATRGTTKRRRARQARRRYTWRPLRTCSAAVPSRCPTSSPTATRPAPATAAAAREGMGYSALEPLSHRRRCRRRPSWMSRQPRGAVAPPSHASVARSVSCSSPWAWRPTAAWTATAQRAVTATAAARGLRTCCCRRGLAWAAGRPCTRACRGRRCRCWPPWVWGPLAPPPASLMPARRRSRQPWKPPTPTSRRWRPRRRRSVPRPGAWTRGSGRRCCGTCFAPTPSGRI